MFAVTLAMIAIRLYLQLTWVLNIQTKNESILDLNEQVIALYNEMGSLFSKGAAYKYSPLTLVEALKRAETSIGLLAVMEVFGMGYCDWLQK